MPRLPQWLIVPSEQITFLDLLELITGKVINKSLHKLLFLLIIIQDMIFRVSYE